MAASNRKPAHNRQPITAHPLFPAVVALWFGALFGLGSLAIRPGLIEHAVLAVGIDTVIPAAAPPLGFTARILLALLMGALGGIVGALAAKVLRREPSAETRAPRANGSSARRDLAETMPTRNDSRRPVLSREDIGDVDALAPLPREQDDNDEDDDSVLPAMPATITGGLAGRRRPLALAEDTTSTIPEFAPLPGSMTEREPVHTADMADAPHLLDIAAFDRILGISDAEAEAPVQDASLDLSSFAPPRRFAAPPSLEETLTPFVEPAPAAVSVAMAPEELPADAPVAAPDSARAVFMPFSAPPLFAQAAAVVAEAEAPPAAPTEPAAEPAAEPAIDTSVPHQSQSQSQPSALVARLSTVAAARLTSADLDALSPVELIERLALSLQHRREQARMPSASQAAGESSAAMPAQPAIPADASAHLAPEVPAEAVVRAETFAADPAAVEPLELVTALDQPSEMQESAAGTAEPWVANAPAPHPMPAALRTLDLALADAENGDDADSFGLPPRQLVQPQPVPSQAGQTRPFAPAPLVRQPLSVCAVNTEQRGFVRIDDEPDSDDIEPAVVFPGQAARANAVLPIVQAPALVPGMIVPGINEAASATLATVEVATHAEQKVLRRFDAPGSNGVAGAVAPPPPPILDPDETERSLRAALATLQRMSGAA